MTHLLGGSFSPIGWVVGFIHAPKDRVLAELVEWRRRLGQTIELSTATRYPDCLNLLEPLESPWTTELLMNCGEWTTYLNNQKDGGDPTSAAAVLSTHLGTRCVISMHSPLHGGTQMWVLGPDGQPPLRYERTITAVAEDGRWKWAESGSLLPFEDVGRYTAHRIRDRFDRALLVSYLAQLEIRVDDPAWFGPGTVVRQSVAWPTNPETREDAACRLAVITEQEPCGTPRSRARTALRG